MRADGLTPIDRERILARLTASRKEEPDRFERSPLPYPREFDDQIDLFAEAAQRAFLGDVAGARSLISTLDSHAMLDWYDKIAQHVGDVRYTLVSGNPPRRRSGGGGHPTPSPARVAAIAARDGHRCGYCGIRVIEPETLRRIQAKVGRDVLPSKSNKKAASNRDYHGIWVTTAVTLDHVVPFAECSDDSNRNLITSCWACNFGKYDYTCQELEIALPTLGGAPRGSWSGLRDVVQETLECWWWETGAVYYRLTTGLRFEKLTSAGWIAADGSYLRRCLEDPSFREVDLG